MLIFAKAPVPGKVKTRLISALGAKGAAVLHRQMLAQTVAMAVDSGVGVVELCCAPSVVHPDFEDLQARFGIALSGQRGADLGERMRHAAAESLKRAPAVLLMGTDCPALARGHFEGATASLAEGYDAVIVPAEDGGYVLLGLRRAEPSLFTGIDWGRDTVLVATRERMRALGWRWKELETLWDVDRPQDLTRFNVPDGIPWGRDK